MAFQDKKFLDAAGITHLVGLLDEYPNNQVLGTVIDAIEGELEQKADKNEIPEVPVQDVQVDETSVVNDGVANIPLGSTQSYGVVKIAGGMGLQFHGTGGLMLSTPTSYELRAGGNTSVAIKPSIQHESTFYGLAKVAGHDEKDSTEPVGTYTPEAKAAIQKMLGVSDLIATEENNLIASKAYAVGDVFTANGKLYKATAAIAVDGAIITDGASANCEETNVGEGFPHDVQVNSVSVVQNGVASIPIAQNHSGTNDDYGLVKINGNNGITIASDGCLSIVRPSEAGYKSANDNYKTITPYGQHWATFYGLAKIAGADEKDSTLPVGQYTDTAKTAIRSMLGATSSNVIAVQDTQPTDSDTKIWLPETAETPVEVPTYAEMETALAGKVGDVQVNGTSIIQNGVADVPVVTANGSVALGLVKPQAGLGTGVASNGGLAVVKAEESAIKSGFDEYRPIVPQRQHMAVFYGLAKAAGDTTQSASSNAVGAYTDDAKLAIQTMLGIDLSSIASEVEIPLVETVTGTDVTIDGQPNTRYNCGEVSTITINPPAAGSIDVIFTSGTSVAVLTLPSTVKMPEWFDATTLETDTIYEILITDGVYGSVMTWAN